MSDVFSHFAAAGDCELLVQMTDNVVYRARGDNSKLEVVKKGMRFIDRICYEVWFDLLDE